MEQRLLGNTGRRLSVIGFGGILVMNATPGEADQRVAYAIEHGVTYFDVAPSYGNAEEKLGPALAPYRDDVFLACKTGKRDADGAQAELEKSLRQLQTDHFDLYQLHALSRHEDWDEAVGPGGALEAIQKARDAGKIRHIGFSAHSAEVAVRALSEFPFDSALFPVNYVTWYNANFGPQILDAAKARNAGRLALKAMARGPIPDGQPKPYEKCWYMPEDDENAAALGLRWTLSQDITAAVPPGEWPFFEIAVRTAENFQPVSDAETNALRRRAEAGTPLFELQAA